MQKLFGSAEGLLNRLLTWAGAYSVLTGFLGWVASNLKALQPYGWPEALIVGLLLASVVTLTLAAGMVAWRYFRPLAADSATKQVAAASHGYVSPYEGKTPALIYVTPAELKQQFGSVIENFEARLSPLRDNVDTALNANTHLIQQLTGQVGNPGRKAADAA